jgi:hypothetical protein
MLLNGLPSAELEAIGEILIEAARAEYPLPEDALPAAHKTLAYAKLSQVMSRALDSIPEIPLFYVHLGASQNAIVRDMEDQVRRWKKRRGLGSSKVHTEKIDTYLEVWDLREGWTGSGYERGRELSFAAVARRLKSGSISKVATRYRAAFKLITGHEFSPELWLRLFGPLKLSELLGDPITLLSKPIRHRFGSPGPRAVPDSVISPATDDVSTPGVVASSATVDGDIETAELLMDINSLIDRSLSDNEVAAELDLNDPGLVAYYRSKIEDLRSL